MGVFSPKYGPDLSQNLITSSLGQVLPTYKIQKHLFITFEDKFFNKTNDITSLVKVMIVKVSKLSIMLNSTFDDSVNTNTYLKCTSIALFQLRTLWNNVMNTTIIKVLFMYLFGVLRHFQHCTGHITTGSWKGRGNQYIQFVRVLYCKLLTKGKQLPAFPLEAMLGTEP